MAYSAHFFQYEKDRSFFVKLQWHDASWDIMVPFFFLFQKISFHNIGAFTGFVSALIYCWLQSLMSYKLRDHGVINSTAVCHSRAMLSAIMTFAFIIFFIFQTIAHIEWDYRRPDSPYLAKLKWGPEDPGYICHVTSNIAEWTMTGAFFLFVTTFLSEFRQIRITSDISSTEYWEWNVITTSILKIYARLAWSVRLTVISAKSLMEIESTHLSVVPSDNFLHKNSFFDKTVFELNPIWFLLLDAVSFISHFVQVLIKFRSIVIKSIERTLKR